MVARCISEPEAENARWAAQTSAEAGRGRDSDQESSMPNQEEGVGSRADDARPAGRKLTAFERRQTHHRTRPDPDCRVIPYTTVGAALDRALGQSGLV